MRIAEQLLDEYGRDQTDGTLEVAHFDYAFLQGMLDLPGVKIHVAGHSKALNE